MDRRLSLLSLAPLALFAACNTGTTDIDAQLSEEYGALEADTRDEAERNAGRTERERNDEDASRFPSICRELVVDVDIVARERTDDGRDVGRDDGESRDDVDNRTDRVRSVFGERASGRRVWFARVDDEGGRRALLAGEVDDDGRVTGRVLDRQRRVRGAFVGHRDGDHLRARIRLACRDLVNEGEREDHDEDNTRARAAAERIERGEGVLPGEREASRSRERANERIERLYDRARDRSKVDAGDRVRDLRGSTRGATDTDERDDSGDGERDRG